MSSKTKKIIILVVCIVVAILNGIFTYFLASPMLSLKGEKKLTINLNSEYQDAGFEATYLGRKIDKNVTKKGQVDTAKLGTYTITYVLKKGLYEKEVTRTIVVKDLEKPVLELKGEKKVTVCPKGEYKEEGYTATDNVDGDITDKVKWENKDQKIIYTVTDAAGNKVTAEREIVYQDTKAPTIKLTGGNTYTIYVGETFKEPGYTATDECEGDLTKQVKVSGTVDGSKTGSYKITYEVSDKEANKAVVTRTVKVVEKQATGGGIVYLTFDDGPGQYTEKILSILKENNVKASFFVTNQFPKYQSMIKKEYEDGHTVAIHTYSHSWSIYDSVDSYLNDFNKMDKIVFEQTGEHPKYFRFPGGSSNTVSRKHQTGIMTKLAQVMTDKGYIYFDWHVDCGDTHKNNTVSYIISNIKKYVRGNGSYIILMHDIKKNTMQALPDIIAYLKNNGYTFKALDDNAPVKHFKIAN